MTSRHKYGIASGLVLLLGIGLVVYLVRRKPIINVSGVVELGEPTVTYKATVGAVQPETDMQRLIRISSEAIRADDAEGS